MLDCLLVVSQSSLAVRQLAQVGLDADLVLEFLGNRPALLESIDSLLITGATTSGCVRASVVDAFSHGYKCFIVEECTFDRFELSHLVNLFDMNAKYADVISLEEALTYLNETL